MINGKTIKMRYLLLFFILLFSLQHQAYSENILGDFLVAKPSMLDSRFKETVIVMLYHNQSEGAAGLVINKPIKTMSIIEFFKEINQTLPKNIYKKEITVYWGGPVESEQIFFIHSSEYDNKDFIFSNKNFTITTTPNVFFDIAINKGPKKYLILSGIAVWSPGQLDFEMTKGDWEKKTNSYIPLFDNGNEMWNRLISSQDI